MWISGNFSFELLQTTFAARRTLCFLMYFQNSLDFVLFLCLELGVDQEIMTTNGTVAMPSDEAFLFELTNLSLILKCEK